MRLFYFKKTTLLTFSLWWILLSTIVFFSWISHVQYIYQCDNQNNTSALYQEEPWTATTGNEIEKKNFEKITPNEIEEKPNEKITPNEIEEKNFKLPSIEEKVEACMRMANLDSEPLLTTAKQNARYFLNEYRRAIPQERLSGYRSHCWNANLYSTWRINGKKGFISSIGNLTFLYNQSSRYFPPYGGYLYSYLPKHYPKGEFESNIVCLPNVYIIGYEKCGSTFLFSFINNLVSMSTGYWNQRQIVKEPQFWALFEAYEDRKKHVPMAEDLNKYLLNYIPGIEAVSTLNLTNIMLIDGTPNYVTEWPVFTKEESNLTNYCLLPAALPILFPASKYIAIMRNPIDMVYSNFWWSCVKNGIPIPKASRGPDIFHKRIMSKIQTFNRCMKNESIPSISFECKLTSQSNYSSCIKQRLHLLDKCSVIILASKYDSDMPTCGDSSIALGMFYVHIRKWLKVVGKESLLLLTLENVNSHPNKAAEDILKFLDLNVTIASIEENVKMAMNTQVKKNKQSKYDYKEQASLQMRNETRTALEVFFHPFNKLLAELLMDDKYAWF